MAWRYDLPKCPVSPADRGEFMKPSVREAIAELVANRDGNTLVTGNRGINIADHDKEKYRKFADRILTLVGRGAVIGWQDIETAPHETRVLLGWIYDGAWFCETGMASHGWRRNGISNMSRHGQATHWQPLPDGPAK